MTTYTFKPKSNTTFVNWNDPTIWTGGVVPNASDADVDFPTVTYTGSTEVYTSTVFVSSPDSFTTRSIALRDYLQISGTLTVSGALTQYRYGQIIMDGGHLTAGSIVNDATAIYGSGTIDVGTLTNDTTISGGGALTINATRVANIGSLGGGTGSLLLTVGTGGIEGLADGTLSAGQLSDGVRIDAGTLITTDAATISLTGTGTIESRNPAGGAWVPITQSLHTVATGGTLAILNGSYQFQQLAIAGTATVNGTSQFGGDSLTVSAGGSLVGGGTITSAIDNEGVVRAGMAPSGGFSPYPSSPKLTIEGAVTGNGHLEITAGHLTTSRYDIGYSYTLELNGASAQRIVFANDIGLLQLDQPSSYTGTIETVGSGDHVVLAGVSLSSITSVGYTGDTTGGTLTLQTAGGPIALQFAGDHKVGNFALAAGPQQLSSDPPSLDITIAANAATHSVQSDFNGDGRSDILWRNVGGQLSDWLGGPAGGFTQNDANALTGAPTSWHVAGTGDFNGDGRSDILWRNDSGQLSDWLGQANGGFAQNDSNAFTSAPTSWHVAGTGDFNGDGRADILWRSDSGQLSDWLGKANGGFTQNDANAFTGAPTSWKIAGTGDFNGDGRADILWRNDNGQLSDWLGQANGGFVQNDANAMTNVPTSWHVAGAGDFNGDGRADILWRSDSGQLSDWLGQANGGLAQNDANAFTGAPNSWHVVEIGDYNGDGRSDILWRNDNGQLSDWLGQANGGFVQNDANAFTSAPTSWITQPIHDLLI